MKPIINKYIYTVAVLLAVAMRLSAQTPADDQQRINAIKVDPAYLWAMGTSTSSAEDAAECARLLIGEQVELWLRETGIDDRDRIAGCVVKAKEEMSDIPTQNRKVFRCLSYVKKSDILSYTDSDQVLLVEFGGTDKDAAQVEAAPPATEPAEVAEVAATTPDPVVAPAPESVPETAVAPKTEPTPEPTPAAFVPTAQERPLLAIETFEQLRAFITDGYNAGSITRFGKYKERPASGSYHMVVYAPDGSIPARFRVEKDGTMVNLATGQTETMDAYKGNGAFWFIFKK